MRIHVEVTQEDIDQGECGHAFRCALALAIARASGLMPEEDFGVSGDAVDVYYGGGEYAHQVPLPPVITKWVEDFDQGDAIEPFTFDLELPVEAQV